MKLRNIFFVSLVAGSVAAGTSFAAAPQGSALKLNLNHAFADYPNGCPEGFPLDCGNNVCCAEGHTLFCSQMERSPCIDPTGLADDTLKFLADICDPLLSCK